MKLIRKDPVAVGFLVLVMVSIVALAYRGITHHFYPALEPLSASSVSRISTIALFITAVVFYGVVILGLIVARRSWIEVLTLGGVLFMFCFCINMLLPPVGGVIFVGFHCVWLVVWIRSALHKSKQSDHDRAA